MKLRTMITAAAVVAVAAVPATASAAGSVSGGPVKVPGGYTVALHATDARKDTLTITIDRGSVSRGQTDALVFTTGVRVTVRGATASIKGSLGAHGKVDLRLRSARSSSKKLPKGCTGTPGVTRSGRLEGVLELRLPNGKKTTIRSLPASSSVGGRVECGSTDTRPGGDGEGDDGAGDDGQPRLMLSAESGGASFVFLATKSSLMLTRNVAAQKQRGVTVATSSTVRASGTNLLQPADGGARAGVQSAGTFTGNGSYTSTVGPGPATTGPLGGSLSVKIQGAPVLSIVGDNALLLNGDK